MLQVPVHPVPMTSMEYLEIVEQMVKVAHGPIRFMSSKVNIQVHETYVYPSIAGSVIYFVVSSSFF